VNASLGVNTILILRFVTSAAKMPNTCCAIGCTNRASKNSSKRFFRVPADPERKIKWILAINRKHWVPNEYSRLCSDHFITGELKSIVLMNSTFYLFVQASQTWTLYILTMLPACSRKETELKQNESLKDTSG